MEREFFLRSHSPFASSKFSVKIIKTGSHITITYFNFNFLQIAGQAHAVVLAGGTLQPIEETRVRLFPGLALDQVHFFTCNHIVPPENILPIAVSRGPSGMTFDFSYNSRSTPTMVCTQDSLVFILVVACWIMKSSRALLASKS